MNQLLNRSVMRILFYGCKDERVPEPFVNVPVCVYICSPGELSSLPSWYLLYEMTQHNRTSLSPCWCILVNDCKQRETGKGQHERRRTSVALHLFCVCCSFPNFQQFTVVNQTQSKVEVPPVLSSSRFVSMFLCRICSNDIYILIQVEKILRLGLTSPPFPFYLAMLMLLNDWLLRAGANKASYPIDFCS